MPRYEKVIASVAATIASSISAAFVVFFSESLHHEFTGQYHRAILPLLAEWVAYSARWAFGVPLIVGGLGIVMSAKAGHHGWIGAVARQVCWVFALAWPLVCIHGFTVLLI